MGGASWSGKVDSTPWRVRAFPQIISLWQSLFHHW
jgi:hypothetical protein